MPITPEFDLTGPAYFADPHAAFRRLRDDAPVWFSPRLQRWIVTRYDDVQAILRDPQRFSSRVVPQLPSGERGGPLAEFERLSARWLFFLDPPDHAAPRRRLARGLSDVATDLAADHAGGSTLEALEAWATERLHQTLAASEPDLIAGFTHPLAARAMGQVLCPGDLPAFLALCQQMEAASRTPRDPDRRRAGLAAMAGVTALVSRLADQAGAGASPVIDAVAAGGGSSAPSHEEIAAQALVLVFAGVETTQNLIGNALAALAAQPSVRATLIEQPALLPQAVEELLRFDPSVLGVVRRATEHVSLGGLQIPAGAELVAMVAAANRDPVRFPRPDDFDLLRPPGGHLAFGGGIHYCAGANWARRTTELALGVCLRGLPHWRLAPLTWRSHDPLVRGLIACQLSH